MEPKNLWVGGPNNIGKQGYYAEKCDMSNYWWFLCKNL